MYFIKGKNATLSEKSVQDIFKLTYDLMKGLVTVQSYDEDYKIWRSYFNKNEKSCFIVLYENDEEIRGYLDYQMNLNEVIISNLMIDPKYQFDGKTILSLINQFVDDIKDRNIIGIKASTNKRNVRMQKIFDKLGFIKEFETERQFNYSINKNHFITYYNHHFNRE